jgi:2-polyprenyl-6-methoxyphenol hydroxylase-like FAD-dependent oxidoreductase
VCAHPICLLLFLAKQYRADDEQYRFVFPEFRDARTGKHVYSSEYVGGTNVHRSNLLNMLVSGLACRYGAYRHFSQISKLPSNVKVTFSARVTDVKQRSNGVTVYCDRFAPDGTKIGTETYEGDALIAADGVKSAVRRCLFPDLPNAGERYTGTYAYRSLIPIEKVTAAVGDHMSVAPGSWLQWGRFPDSYTAAP